MSPLVTILIYVVIPLGVYVLFMALILRPSGRAAGARWRSGSAWDHEPVWWMANPRGSGVAGPGAPTGADADAPTPRTARGGARGTW